MIPNISLLTGNMQPTGHPFFVDQKTVDGAAALLNGKPLASYLSHAGADKDRLGSAIGFFKGIYSDGVRLRAKSFEFLDSFKANFKATYDNLSELAQKLPDQFGVSLNLKYRPVWVMHDGTEVPAKIVDGKLAESAPVGAIRALPSARVTAIPSGDFVTFPAANLTGLLCGLLAEIDTTSTNMSQETVTTFDQAALDAKLGEQKAALTAELSAAHKTALDSVTAKLTEAEAGLTAATKSKDEAVSALAARDAELTATLAASGVKVDKIDADTIKAALAAKISSEAQSFLAARGMKPLPEQVKESEAASKKPVTDDEIAAAYLALKAGSNESISFLEEHRDAIWRSHTGKK